MTDIWKLPTKQRVIVNMAGVQIQLLINLAIIVAAASCTSQYWYRTLIQLGLINLFSVIANLNQFFKFDGYWVIADMSNLPNLSRSSNQWLRDIFTSNSSTMQPVLVIYSVARVVFIACTVLVMANEIPQFLHNTYMFYLESWGAENLNGAAYREAIQRTLGVMLLTYSVGRFGLTLLRSVSGTRPKEKK